MLEFLLNYITVGVAAASFIVLLSTFIIKIKSLSKIQKIGILLSLIILILYFCFIAMLIIGGVPCAKPNGYIALYAAIKLETGYEKIPYFKTSLSFALSVSKKQLSMCNK